MYAYMYIHACTYMNESHLAWKKKRGRKTEI